MAERNTTRENPGAVEVIRGPLTRGSFRLRAKRLGGLSRCRRNSTTSIAALTVFLGLCGPADPHAALAQGKGAALVVDSPSFRKLTGAVVPLTADPAGAADLVDLGKRSAATLASLLTYSRLFDVLDESAFTEVARTSARKAPAVAKDGLDGVDIESWRSIRVESLTVGKVSREAAGLVFELRSVDVRRGTLLVAKKYQGVQPGDVDRVLRRYADAMLLAYTGRPGIFSSRIVFVGRRQKKSDKQIYLVDFDGSNLVQITNEPTVHMSPAWSPDGKYLVYTSFRDGNPDVMLYELGSGKIKKLGSTQGLESGGSFAPDGKFVAMTANGRRDADIFIVDLMTPTSRRLLIEGDGVDVDPMMSPDGKLLAWVSGRFERPHIFVGSIEAKDGKMGISSDKRLTFAGWYNSTPAWSPDSKRIAFCGYDKDIDRWDLFVMNADGANIERLTLKQGRNERPSWSPNGLMLVFMSDRIENSDVRAQSHLYVMYHDGSQQRRIDEPLGFYESYQPQWGPVEVAD